MLRLLLVEDDAPAAELTLHALQAAGLACTCDRVTSEVEFRAALAHAPDLVLSDSNVPGFDGMAALAIVKAERPAVPVLFFSGHMDQTAVRRALESGAAGYVPKAELPRLPGAVRLALADGRAAVRRASDRTGPRADGGDSAEYLLQRQAVLERTLRAQDSSKLSSLLSRTPPAPAALVAIDSGTTRERYIKLLGTTDIELEIARDSSDALRRLAERTHAVLFTDRLELIRETRQLNAGSAIHIIFIHAADGRDPTEGLRAGANDVMPEEGRGEHFWVHLSNARRIVSFADSLQSAITDNRLLSTIDELTHVGTRRYFEHQWPREVARAVRFQRPLSLVMCDIDHFKAINDQHGHVAGDDVLREFGDRLTQGLRMGEDWVARIGGEEFAIVLPETGRFQAHAIAERLRHAIAARPMAIGQVALTATASFGFCSLEEAYPRTPELKERMVVAADDALYRSKRSGRNRVSEVLLRLTAD